MKFFNSIENQKKDKIKSRLRQRYRRRLAREKVLREVSEQRKKLAFTNALAEVLAIQVKEAK